MADGTKRQAAQNPAESGRGLGLLSLIVGLAAGGAVYWITDRWIDARTPSPASLTVLQTIVVFAAGWLLLSERRDFVRPVIPAAIIAAIVAAPTFTLSAAAANADGDLGLFPVFAWFAVSAPLATYLMTSLAKATLETGAPPKYASIFFHGLTLPLVAGGAAIFAGLSLVLLYAWAALLKQMDVVFFRAV
ncbi:MAG: hypothetical protein R3C42_00095 [Parvularculaceae bacterium]